MKACNGFCKCLAVGLVAMGATAYGQEFSWVPVDASFAFTTDTPDSAGANTRATGDASTSARIIEFELRVNGWINAPGAPTLGTAQAGVDATGFLGANAVPANAGVDLTPLNNQVWAGSAVVHANSGANGKNDGAHIVTKTWHLNGLTNTKIPSGSIPAMTWSASPPGFHLSLDNPDFVFFGNLAVGSVATSVPNYVWGGVSNAGQCTADAGNSYYLGTLILNVPAGAKGQYNFGFDPALATTFMNDCAGSALPGVARTPGHLLLRTGACCTKPAGLDPTCQSGVIGGNCAAGNQNFFIGQACEDAGFECPSCETNADCLPGPAGACDTDVCLPDQTCQHTLIYDPVTQCCNNGALTTINDGDVCTVDSCVGGVADHDPAGAAGFACNDGITRTCPDECDGVNSQADGGCVGTEISTYPCTSDADCCIGFCDLAVGYCQLIEDPSLCIEFSDASIGNNCYGAGEEFTGTVIVGGSSQTITGGQFLMNYDPTCIEVLGVHACAGSVFDNVIASSINATAGTIFFAVTVDPTVGIGTNADADIVCLDLRRKDGCDDCDICFTSVNPYNTRLVNADGNVVSTNNECGPCSKLVGLAGEIDLDAPAGDDVNSECDLPTAVITWNAPSASDTCDGPLTLTCDSEHDGGVPIGHLLMGGGEFPQGTSFFICSAENSCGEVERKVWTVKVSDQQSLDIYVQLEPVVYPGLFSRCICFELFDDCVSDPTPYCDTLWFGGPYNFPGKTRGKVKVDKGQYHCVTARDPLHTLRSTADIFCVDGQYQAEFRGDPLLGGNWLVGGNLDAWKAGGSVDTIDILDFGMFMNCVAAGADYANGNTNCGTAGPHCDINGDGDVDASDYAFILDNYLKASKNSCCPDSDFIPAPVESITVKELRARGMGELAIGDLNRDGVLNSDDMGEYMAGVQPVVTERVRKGSKAEGARGR